MLAGISQRIVLASVLAGADTGHAAKGASKVRGFVITESMGDNHNRFISLCQQLCGCVIPGLFQKFTIA